MDEPRVLGICPYHLREFSWQAKECFMGQTYPNRDWIDWDTSKIKKPIGALRNQIIRDAIYGDENGRYAMPCDIIAHFDHDDWSCPTRLAEQVAFLQSSGASIIGYRDMPFYDVRTQQVTFYRQPKQNYALGTSLMYWRHVWERTPFIEVPGDEDSKFEETVGYENVKTQSSLEGGSPRMVARIHPGNTSPKGGARYEKATPELTAAVLACLSRSSVANSI